MKRKAIIVAGGTGTRMQANKPKQFLKIGNQVILMRSIRLFHTFDPEMEIIITLPQHEISRWNELCKQEGFSITHRIVAGGNQRFNSVKNALQTITEDSLIAVHDGVRPLVSQETLQKTFQKAAETGNAIPVQSIHDSIRYITEHQNKAVDRDRYKIVQTPQVFASNILQSAYQQAYQPGFTDDASVVEYTGITISTIEGNPENLKITTKKDLDIAEVLLSYL